MLESRFITDNPESHMPNYYERMKYNGGGNGHSFHDFDGRHEEPTPSDGAEVDWDRLELLVAGRISGIYVPGLYTVGMIAKDLGQRRDGVDYYIRNHPDISPIIRTRTIRLYGTSVWYEMQRLFNKSASRPGAFPGNQFIDESEL